MISKIWKRFLKDDTRGAISVEIALIASAIFLSTLPVADIMVRVHSGLQVSSAVRAGMQYAMNNPTDYDGIEDIVLQNAGALDADEFTVVASEFCECNGTAQTCGDVCAYGEQSYVNVTGTYNQSLMINYPVYGNTTVITRELAMRVE